MAASCKPCARERARIWRENNRERHRETSKEYFYKNKDEYNLRSKAFYKNNQDVMKQKQRERNKRNSQKLSISRRAWREKNPGWGVDYYHKVQKNSPTYLASSAIRRILHKLLKRTSTTKTARSSEILGYTSASLRARLEYQFKPGMSWGNYGKWHIDHKIPIARFLAKGETRPDIINALSNLQPLWAEDNMRKGARMTA